MKLSEYLLQLERLLEKRGGPAYPNDHTYRFRRLDRISGTQRQPKKDRSV